MRKWMKLLLLAGLLCLLPGCGNSQEEEESGYQIWYMNQDETRVEYENKELQAKNTAGLVKEALEVMREQPSDDGLKSALPEQVTVSDFELEDGVLSVNFSVEYLEMEKVYEVLCRAAVVRTLCQLPGIESVEFLVAGESLTDLDGAIVGLMDEDQFIENAGDEINAYTTAVLTLYYTNEAGDRLVKQQVEMEYNSNISLEKLIVERLIEGPPLDGAYPTIPTDTNLISISTKEGICYVNLDEGFLETGYNVTESIPVYSIVNSLIANTEASKVQISINGETDMVFRESINFNTVFEMNEELVEE